MKVRELKKQLENLDDDFDVYIAKDKEGNGFEDLYSVETENIYADYSGEVEVIHNDDVEDYAPEHIKEGIVLWP